MKLHYELVNQIMQAARMHYTSRDPNRRKIVIAGNRFRTGNATIHDRSVLINAARDLLKLEIMR